MTESPPASSASRICWYAIVKDETAVLDRLLSSLSQWIDCWVVCDTGSTDGTPERVAGFFEREGIPGELHRIPFGDFGRARNEALDLARTSALSFDWLLLCDAHMELVVEDAGFARKLTGDAGLVTQVAGPLSYRNIRLLRRAASARYVAATHEFLAVEGTVAPFSTGSASSTTRTAAAGRRRRSGTSPSSRRRSRRTRPTSARSSTSRRRCARPAGSTRRSTPAAAGPRPAGSRRRPGTREGPGGRSPFSPSRRVPRPRPRTGTSPGGTLPAGPAPQRSFSARPRPSSSFPTSPRAGPGSTRASPGTGRACSPSFARRTM